MNRYRIELLGTAEGINLKKDKTKDAVTIFLQAKNEKEARKFAAKIAVALAISTHIGMLEHIVMSVHPDGLPLIKKEKGQFKYIY